MPRLVVEIVGDASALEKTFRRTQQQTTRFSAQMEGVGRNMTRSLAAAGAGFFGVRGLVNGLESSVEAASDLAEQMSKTNQVFGRSATGVQDWSQTTAAAMGISQRQALATASSFGALFQPMGLVGPKAAEQSEKLTQLGADLASFYNTDVADALEAIRSGIVGESEPLRRYGVLLSETRVQAKALADTHKQSAKDLTAAEKAAARIAIIMHDTSKAQGDFARTSEGLANQSREFKAQMDELKTNIGAFYVPGLTRLAKAANEALEALSPPEDRGPSDRVRATLVPKLALYYGQLRDFGIGAGGAISLLNEYLGKTPQAMELIGDAINYFAGGPMRQQIERLRQEVLNLGTDADTAAKAIAGAAQSAARIAQAATAAVAAAPRGVAALSPAQQAALGVAGARTQAEQLAALRQQHRINMGTIEFIKRHLARSTGRQAQTWAEHLENALLADSATLDRIRGIQQDIAQKARDVLQRQRDALQRQREAARKAREAARQALENRGRAVADALEIGGLPTLGVQGGLTVGMVNTAMIKRQRAGFERRLSWAQFAAERAEATKGIRDDLKTARLIEKILTDQIRVEGRTLELVRQRWQIRQKIRDLNKTKSEQITPGMGAVGGPRLAAMLAQGLGVGAAARINQNIAGLKLTAVDVNAHVYLDGREVTSTVTRRQAQTSHRTARQTSGLRG